MDTAIAFAELLLGFVPFVGLVALIVTPVWIITKMFPSVGEWFDTKSDRLFGVDADYDAKYHTEFRIHPANYMKATSR